MTADDIRENTSTALEEIKGATDKGALESLRIKYLGKKGLLPQVMKALGAADKADKAEIGKLANEFKVRVGDAVKARAEELEQGGDVSSIDYSLAGNWKAFGQ